jgi:N utilization substance protein B
VNEEPRDIALQRLYEVEQRGTESVDPTDLPDKSLRIITGVLEHLRELDRSIEDASEHWTLDRMPPVDRTILRMGLYELRFEPQTPAAVIISECVRLARKFSTERSGSFVNGVLGHLSGLERR